MATTDTGRTTVTSGGTAVQPVDPTKHIADPGPLGLAGFAATTFALSVVNAGLIGKGAAPVVLPLALFYGGLAQLLAGMWEFRKNNTFGATAFGTYGAFWIAYALYAWQFMDKIGPADQAHATGLFLLVFTIFTGYMAIASVRTSVALMGVLVLLFLTYLFLTIGEFSGSDSMAKVGGWLGLVTAVVAWYASFASVVNSTFKRTILPVVPLTAR